MSGNNKIALITGAGSGVGRAVALAMAKEGYTVVITGRRASALDETVAAGQGLSGSLVAIPADLTDPDQVAKLFATVKDKFGRLDVLFNNAGVNAPPGVLLEDLDPKDWQTVVNTNLSAVFYCTQQAFKIMKAQTPHGGRIINNGSVSSQAPRPNSIPYTATKHAVSGLTKTTSLDGRKYDIACGQIDIGNAASAMTSAMSGGVPQANGTMAPEPVMDVANVASAVVYMASLPLDANVQNITVMATKMPLVGRG
jgi:NAD(P)-dependent dehydrogenase (short-subunit alcohol dehydrogenase family)